MKIENCANTYAVAAPHLLTHPAICYWMCVAVLCSYLPGPNCFIIEDRNSYLIQLIICNLVFSKGGETARSSEKQFISDSDSFRDFPNRDGKMTFDLNLSSGQHIIAH